MPPYIVSDEEIEHLSKAISQALGVSLAEIPEKSA
jgi:adenosylmethionine-8-amino-7-oxononanoate aminotransferase